jgi:hypothetical protein
MNQEHKLEIEEIMNGLECPHDFNCYKQGAESFCKAGDVGLETFVECFEEYPYGCPFSMSLSGVYYCKCPLRVHIVKKLKK